ncbi:hypothetical protein KGM_202225 [Danaus plexippus plexippus]|uniref:Uncharacterized protein n=1 Tax=Danaus plexippus plexippus TaxID=278856 RepID=A0A212F5M3_DANPL|nr:hypothetical protein KGM_202225 [Danaus plexippus plexippus]
MYVSVIYKEAPELSAQRRRSSEPDPSIEKVLLVNPNCPVRIMLEYIRKRCRLGKFTEFDLCDETGHLMGLFDMPTYVYTTDKFEHKRTYYIIIMKQEADRRISVLPQLNHENQIYMDLKTKVKKYLAGDGTPPTPTSASTPPGKVTPPVTKPSAKKK